MLEDQVAYLLQSYLGNYVQGLNKEALKISVWQGDVELTNMQLKPEALNALKLPVKVKAGFLGSVKLKVPWSRLGQDPVLVYLDRIFLLAEPATEVESHSEDAVQEAKKSRVREMEIKLVEKAQRMKTVMNKSWLGSFISTIIGNLKLSISNVHIRYEDIESNPGHPFAAGVTLEKLSAVTVDDSGKETFVSGGSLDRIQKFVELDRLAFYLDSDISPWYVSKPWADLQPREWVNVFRFGTKNGKPADGHIQKHSYILQPVSGNAKYVKLRPNEATDVSQPLQKASVNLDDVTLCLSKNGYMDMLKLADNFAAFNQRLKYAHYRPLFPVKSHPKAWWKYAYKVVCDQMQKASGKMSWKEVLKFASLRKRYISLYASLLKSDLTRIVVDDDKDIEYLDHQLDIDLILQWRMLAHKFVEQSRESDQYLQKQKTKKSWWSFGWNNQSNKEEGDQFFSDEDWERLNRIIGYKEDDSQTIIKTDKVDALQTLLDIHMNHNATKLIDESQDLAVLSCERLDCTIKLYPETKVFDLKLGSYRLSSPNGLLAVSATSHHSLVGVFHYKPYDAKVDWSMTIKASPCYMTYLKDSVDQIIKFFESNTALSQTVALETAAAVQMTIDEVKRTAQQQVNRALKEQSRFFLDLDIAAPKITIPTDFCPDNTNSTKLLLDLGNLLIRTQDDFDHKLTPEPDKYMHFDLILSDVSAFLVDGDYNWNQSHLSEAAGSASSMCVNFLPVIDKCGLTVKLQQIRLQNASYPSTKLAVRVPSLGFHFSPARYHRLLKIAKIFQVEDSTNSDVRRPWDPSDFEGWLSLLIRKGVGNREAVWQRRYFCLAGPFLYILESPNSNSYKQYISLSRKQICQIPVELISDADHVFAVCDASRSNTKVVEDSSALVVRCESEDSSKIWQSRLQGAIYRASVSAPITGLTESSSDEGSETDPSDINDLSDSSMEKIFIIGILDELKVCFSGGDLRDQSFTKVLLTEERHLLEFRAIGGQVEISIRSNDMFIDAIVKSMEIEDLFCSKTADGSFYLARSVVPGLDGHRFSGDAVNQSLDGNDLIPSEGDDNFFEAVETLDSGEYQVQQPGNRVDYVNSLKLLENLLSNPPSFGHLSGKLPHDGFKSRSKGNECNDTIDTFVKAQIVIYDQNSPQYSNIDKQVTVTLSTLSFFCRRPTILALIDFANSININDDSSRHNSMSDIRGPDVIKEDIDNQQEMANEEVVVKGLLGKGKSRVIFKLALNMSRAEVFLMKENEMKLATLSQDNLHADIKVFPSSFSIEAALGNLRISDESLPSSHMYYWACEMRNPGGSSFVELLFTSFSSADEDYNGYEYSLWGKLSEIRVIYLNRFIQEVVNYFMGLVPNSSKGAVKLKDQVTNSEKWFTTSEIEGSPALKLDVSLTKPIILMPRRTESLDFLKLDIVHITVKNTFQWISGSKTDTNAVHLENLRVLVDDINLNVGIGNELSESIIQDVKGVSIVIRRSLRDLFHRVPSIEVAVQIEELKAGLASREYQIISECAVSNFSETPEIMPSLNNYSGKPSTEILDSNTLSPSSDDVESETGSKDRESWIAMKVSVMVNLIELRLHTGVARDACLATVQVSDAWLLYKSTGAGDGYLSASLKGFSVIDDREGTEQEFRLAIGIPENFGSSPLRLQACENNQHMSLSVEDSNVQAIPTMLILDAKFSEFSTSVFLAVQRPQLLVTLDFLLAVVEFFVPSVRNILSDEEDKNSTHAIDAIILDQATYRQPTTEMSLSPERPLVVDDERYDHFTYEGNGGTLYLKDREGLDLSAQSNEAIIYVGNGKSLRFKNVVIKNGKYLDSCIFMGTNSRYSASTEDQVYLDGQDDGLEPNNSRENVDDSRSPNTVTAESGEFIIELQAVSPELTFYNTSRNVGESLTLSNKLLHAQLDAFCRVVLKGNTVDLTGNVLGLTMESNGIRILEPFDTSVKYLNAGGKTNINFSVSDIFMNFSFSILRLFIAVEEDILAFLRRTSKKMTVVCSQFDKVGVIKNPDSAQLYTFWRPHAPPGFAVLGDYLTPTDKPPTKGVLAVNTNYARLKRPISFKRIWPELSSSDISSDYGGSYLLNESLSKGDSFCTIWFPEAPKGYVAMGCVVSNGMSQPPLTSALCISISLVSLCNLRDCITIRTSTPCQSSLAFWRVDNSAGTFLPADPTSFSLKGKAYGLRSMLFGFPEGSPKLLKSSDTQAIPSSSDDTVQRERSSTISSGRHFEPVASFQLIWWNRGSNSRKKFSIWRPVISNGMIYFGDIAVKGFEPPNTSIVLHHSGHEELFRAPLDFQLVGQIKKQRGMENILFWLPQAPPGFVSLGCIASKSAPKQHGLTSLGCIRSDLVTGDHFMEESLWDTSDARSTTEPFSIWTVGKELGTFIVRNGFKKPPRRFALKLADPSVSNDSDDTVIDGEIRTFSAALFDDYGGLMVPLFNISFSGIGCNFRRRKDYLNSSVSFSLAARSYNDKYESWEPLVEPIDGFLRYKYDQNAPGAASQIRITSTKDLNLNVSVSNTNMIIQAYSSWNNLTHSHEYHSKEEASTPSSDGLTINDIHHQRNYYIIPQNKLGQDIYIRATEIRGLSSIIVMPAGDMKSLKVPVSKNMMDSHLEGKLFQKARRMVTVVIADAELPRLEGLSSHDYTVTTRLTPLQNPMDLPHYQSARTRGSNSSQSLSSNLELVLWNEIFIFKVDFLQNYMMDLTVTDVGKGDPIGFFSAHLDQIARTFEDDLYLHNYRKELSWIELSSPGMKDMSKCCGRIRVAVFLSEVSEVENSNQSLVSGKKSGFIQISPSREGPWTTVRLNYAAPAACWRLGNDVVASEVSVKDGNRYVNIRSLVSVHNNTDFILDVCLVCSAHSKNIQPLSEPNNPGALELDSNRVETVEFFETENYNPKLGWVGTIKASQHHSREGIIHLEMSEVELPSGWEWTEDWHLDDKSTSTSDGWVYAPDVGSLKWPDSFSPLTFVNYARQRRWIRKRKQISNELNEIPVGLLKPGNKVPVPLSALTQSRSYVLRIRPSNLNSNEEYSWSSMVSKPDKQADYGDSNCSEICVSTLTESEELLFCSKISGNSLNVSHKLWFCLSIQATEIAKDMHSDPIQDWCLMIKSPLSVANFLPLGAEFSFLEKLENGHFSACSRGILYPGRSEKVYNADIRNPLFFSLIPQRGWLPVHEAVLISHPTEVPSKTLSLRSSTTGRVVQIILEQNHDNMTPFLAKTIRVYAPYWFSIARCPPLTCRLLNLAWKKRARKLSLSFKSEKDSALIEEITEEEMYEGCTIASALNFNLLGLSVSITQSGKQQFGPVKDLAPLGDMDGSVDLFAYDDEGKCMQLYVSTKPSPHQSVPTKMISIRPYMTFTNRLGHDLFIKLSSEDEPKVLHATDSRISFPYHQTGESDKLQVRMEDTSWSFPVHITKEDTIFLVLRDQDGTQRILRTEIRGYEEGSRYIIVFRLGSINGPIMTENRTTSRIISIRQSGFGEEAWTLLQPLSTSNFCWEDPYGQHFMEVKIDGIDASEFWKLDLENSGPYSSENRPAGLCCQVAEESNFKVVRFKDIKTETSGAGDEIQSLDPVNNGNPKVEKIERDVASPMELIIELGVVGVSVVDHKPKELIYLYLEKVVISYSAGYDGGTASRFKLILGHLQLDNQLPLTLIPVLLAPEHSDMNHPAFKMTITARNENRDGVQVYPYIYIRVTEKWWRLTIHEPIIWALVDFYNNLQFARLPQSPSTTQVDPELRIDLIDVSEVKLKASLETAPAQRPHGILGVWSPIMSAVGNAFKIQVHLRRVMHRDRFMRKSAIVPAIGNRIWRDLIHNPLHLIFSVDVLGMTSSTLASLSRGFAELSTDGQFLQLRSKQLWSRKITGVGDGIIQGTEALAQGFAFGVTGVVTKPVENARKNGLLGLAQGVGRAFLGFIVQPVSGALDFFSLTVDGIGASCSKCLEVFSNKVSSQRVRNPRAIHADGILREYCEREAIGQMVLHLAEASTHFGCTDIFKEPSKFALSDCYEDHFNVPYQRIVLITNKRVMLLQCPVLDQMDKKPSKIMWDVPWEEVMTLELAEKPGSAQPSHLIIYLKHFKRTENVVRIIKCMIEEEMEGREPQAVRICSVMYKIWKAHQADMKCHILKVPSSQRHVYFAWSETEGTITRTQKKAIVKSRELLPSGSVSEARRFVKHGINFTKVWSSELELKSRCTICKKKVMESGGIFTIWRSICPDGYVSIGDVARLGSHLPNVAAVYRNSEKHFAQPVGYDLIWRNCVDDYATPVSIWYPRAPEGFISVGCVAVADYTEPEPNLVYCVAESLAEETSFEEQKIWSAPDSYPWGCHIYQVRSGALHFVALRQSKEESNWKPMRVLDETQPHVDSTEFQQEV